MRSRGEDMRGRVGALFRDVEMRKMAQPPDRVGDSGAQCFVCPLCLSSNGVLGARANSFLQQVLGFVKKEGRLGMRSSHPRRVSTWSTTRFSSFWWQQISTAATATSASFVDRVLRADQAAAFESPRSRKPHSCFPRHYYYNPSPGRQYTQYRSRSQGRRSDRTSR